MSDPNDMIYHGGPLLQRPRVVSLYWGRDWRRGAPAKLRTQLDTFYRTLLASKVMQNLWPYDRPGMTIGYGSLAASAVIDTPGSMVKTQPTVSDLDINTMIRAQMLTHPRWPQAGLSTLYLMHLPPDVIGHDRNDNLSCVYWCGYHESAMVAGGPAGPPIGLLSYCVLPYPCHQCLAAYKLGPLQLTTRIASHEIFEAITNPSTGGWTSLAGDEVCDPCEGNQHLGPYVISPIWSNNLPSPGGLLPGGLGPGCTFDVAKLDRTRPKLAWQLVADPASLPAAAGQHFVTVDNDGPILVHPRIVALFWGNAWSHKEEGRFMRQLERFYKWYVRHPYLKRHLDPYSRPDDPFLGATFYGAFQIHGTFEEVTRALDPGDFVDFLSSTLMDHPQWPQPGLSSLYVIHTAPGIAVHDPDSGTYCNEWCGIHEAAAIPVLQKTGNLLERVMPFVLMPYPCPGCCNGLSAFDFTTSCLSHEITEAITDPVLGLGVYLQNPDQQLEVCDPCEEKLVRVGPYLLEPVWSPDHQACR